jgi:predicted TIM-barrel fold metal-dependent hydrolase
LPVIDADTHVDENEHTWNYLEASEAQFKPFVVRDPANTTDYWLVDGLQKGKQIRDDQATGTTLETRELIDVDARLRDMDRMGVDVQVIYPTLMNSPVTDRPEIELALRKSYNRWMAERCARSNGRLRWIVVPPVTAIDKALEELRWAKDHGACGVQKKGNEEAGFWPAEDYFFPLYEEAQRLDMPICFHVGSGTTTIHRPTPSSASYYRVSAPVLHAFQSLVELQIPAKFPTLRWGFIEAYSSWVPYIIYHLSRRVNTRRDRPEVDRFRVGSTAFELGDNVLTSNRFYVTCQYDEDLEYIMKYAGEDNLMMGSDYTHSDFSLQIEFMERLQERADRGELSQSAVTKITRDNPTAFYAL